MTRARDVATQGGLVLLNKTDFSAVASISLNNIFNSTYENYRVIFVTNSSYGSTQIQTNVRLRSNGVDDSSAVYFWSRLYSGAGTSGASSIASGTAWQLGDSHTPNTRFSMDIHLPAVAAKTSYLAQTASDQQNSNVFFIIPNAGITSSTTIYDGISVIPTSGNMTGSIQVYGYKKN